jgi:hypothetical protein
MDNKVAANHSSEMTSSNMGCKIAIVPTQLPCLNRSHQGFAVGVMISEECDNVRRQYCNGRGIHYWAATLNTVSVNWLST